MIPASFDYVRVASVDEALQRLASDADAKVLAGGQSLIPLLKLRLAQPGTLVDIGGLRELAGITRGGDGWRIGALTTYRGVLDQADLMADYPLLHDCVDRIADVQIRNRGTVGGALAHADPASDLPAVALALDGEAVVRNAGGERSVPLTEFLVGPFTTAMEPDELLVALRLPPRHAGSGSAWVALEQSASGYALVGVAAVVAGSATIDHVRVAITGVGEVPYRATAVEDALAGTAPSAADLAAAAAHATDGQSVASDIHADSEYRAALAATLVRRALEQAKARTG